MLAQAGVLAAMVCLTGCDELKFNGMFDVREAMTFTQEAEDRSVCAQKADPSDCRQAGKVVLAAGQYSTKVTIGKSGSKKFVKMEVKTGSKPTKIEMEFDKNIETGDHFVIKADQLKQAYDLAGDISTKVDRTQEQSGYEHCTYQAQEIVCRGGKSEGLELDTETLGDLAEAAGLDKHGPNPPVYHGPNPPVCHPVWVSRPGSQHVRYFYETTTKDIKAGFVQGEKTFGDYQGQSSRTEKVYTYQGHCH
ncbi:MAG: hypothetical protein A3J79_13355 [Elusimicrobia bacterium RIFOXYB2_FULL_62_6]|nr:MAG: hypothetical protein A3J79_13355 [Elusimicrobia bacterium RIFOXYB2_FULL_62_6]